MDNAEKNLITDEERTRYEALFFSQDPIEGLLPGEKARELFLLSKLPLPVLSKVWQLVDIPHDNMLDSTEFTNALYLLQGSLVGRAVPAQLPTEEQHREHIRVPQMSRQEYGAYKKLFMALRRDGYGMVQAETARGVMLCSGLAADVLAHIWNLSDQDRDSKLSLEQFTIACHLVRFCKKGGTLDSPVNVQAMLPHKLPKTDLIAKRRRLSLLEKRKQQLMAQREHCKSQATREGKRVELWKQRLSILTAMHHSLRQTSTSDVDGLLSEKRLEKEKQQLSRLQAVAHRLKTEDDSIRKETSRVIIEEQKLYKEVRALAEEAEQLRKRRQRNSIIKDLDPFHQLYEERKEEKLTGVAVEKPDYQIEIPKGLDPFDVNRIQSPPLSGQQLFSALNNNNKDEPNHVGSDKITDTIRTISSPWSSYPSIGSEDLDPKLMALTQGFEDSFVDSWHEELTESDSGTVNNPGLKELEKDFNFEEHQETVFKTVPVTAEEDDLWRGVGDLTSPSEDLMTLQSQLYTIKEQIKGLGEDGPQVVFKDPESYKRCEETRDDSLSKSPTNTEDSLRERRRYRSVEPSTDSRPRNLHVAERRKKRAATADSQQSRIEPAGAESLKEDPPAENKVFGVDSLGHNSGSDVIKERLNIQDPDLLLSSQLVGGKCGTNVSVVSSEKTGLSPFQHLEIKTDEEFCVADNLNIQHKDALLQIQFDKPDVTRTTTGDNKNSTAITEQATSPQVCQSPGQESQRLDDLPSVQHRGVSSVSRSDRFKKAQTWSGAEDLPVPPPRKKVPKKSSATAPIQVKTLEKTRSESVESLPPEKSVSIDSTSSPQRPPRKESPQKKKSFDIPGNSSDGSHSSCSSTPLCSTSSSPIRNLANKHEVAQVEGTASSESSPVPPPRLRKASRKSKGSPGHGHHGHRSTSSAEVISSPINSEIDTSLYQNVELLNKKSDFTKEIEALFDKVTESEVKESQKHSVENLIDNVDELGQEGSLSLQGKSTSDYFSLSDGSLIEDDMDAAARKLELDKLRNQYFGHKSPNKTVSDEVSKETVLASPGAVGGLNTEVNSTLITVDDYKTTDVTSGTNIKPAVKRVKHDDKHSKSFDSEDSQSKRDSGFLDDAFSSVNFQSDPLLQSSAPSKPVKVSLDLDQYQSEFGSALDSGLSAIASRHELQSTSGEETLTFVETTSEGHVTSSSQEGMNNVLISFEDANSTPAADQDSDISGNGGTFRADFDPFAVNINTNPQVSGALTDDNENLTGHWASSEFSGNFNSMNNNENIGDNAHKHSDSLITIRGEEEERYVNLNTLRIDNLSCVNDHLDSEAPPPPLPSAPPPPLPTNPPPPATSLRSALKFDGNQLDLSSDQPSSDLAIKTANRVDSKKNVGSLIINKAEQDPVGQVPEEFKDVVREPTTDITTPDVGFITPVKKGNNLVQQSFPKEEFSQDKEVTSDKKYRSESEGLSSNTVVKGKEPNASVDHEQLKKEEEKDNISVSSPPQEQEASAMDSLTGLRKTNVSDPVGKAMKFVHDTELSFRVKKVDRSPVEEHDGSYLTGLKTRSQEIQEERQEILDSMKIKKRSFNNWHPESPTDEFGGGGNIMGSDKTESERRYEERKKRQEVARVENGYGSADGAVSPQSPQSPMSGYPGLYMNSSSNSGRQNVEEDSGKNVYTVQADIDSRSLTENKARTKQQWEDHFSSPNAQLFPQQHAKSTEKVQQTQKTVVKLQEPDIDDITVNKPKLNEYESAIEREIRLAQQREEELRREKEQRVRETNPQRENDPGRETLIVTTSQEENYSQKTSPRMSVTKVTTVRSEGGGTVGVEVKSGGGKKTKTLSPQSYREMTEVDRDSVPKQESIIEREIREQMEREEAVRKQAALKLKTAQQQEANQSQQGQKENLKKQESIIEREIRQQRDRDQEAQRLRALAKGVHIPAGGSPSPAIVQTVTASTRKTVQIAPEPVKTETQSSMPREYNPNTGRIDPNIAYSDSISSQNHAGESIISRELREQREREDELREQWTSMGFDVPQSVAPDTPFNMPEPRQPPPIKASFSTPAIYTSTRLSNSQRDSSVLNNNSKYVNIGANTTKSSRRASSDSASSRSTEYSAAEVNAQPTKSKVQPYVGEDSDEEERNYRFIPQSETPVEREIRLAREREEQLRLEKGLPVSTMTKYDSQDSGSEVSYELPTTSEVSRPTTPYRRGQSTDERKTMKQFASSRLQLEIEKDKKRELDLKSVGTIHTLSEDRIGQATRYVDIIPKDAAPPQMPKTPRGPKSAQFLTPADPIRNGGQATAPATKRVEVSVSKQEVAPVVVVRRQSSNTEQVASGGGRGSSTGDSIIERELREMKEREEELRQQQAMLTSHLGPTGVILESEPKQDVRYRQNGNNNNTEVKANRRKSALAEEWEKKFGAAT